MLATEELAPGFSAEELAALTEGYSGSDLKALCVAAAYRPIRELLAAEDKAREAAQGQVAAAAAAAEPTEQDGDGAAGAKAAAAPAAGKAEVANCSKGAAAGDGKEGSDGGCVLRPLCLADFKAAMKQVGPSVAGDTRVMDELKAWNARFGEGGNRRDVSTLTYFL
jgi:SpoVK/Ycf46/Vps4 family AAA+-type ATPase